MNGLIDSISHIGWDCRRPFLASGSQWAYLVRIADVLVGQRVTVSIPG